MTNHQTKKHCLSDFFYSNIADKSYINLKKGLQEYRFFLSALYSALNHLENKDLKNFDALVGENACQIRAIKIALIASENQTDFCLMKEQIELLQNKIRTLLSEKTINQLMSSGISLATLLTEQELDIELTSDLSFALLSHLLSIAKNAQSELSSPFCIRDKSDPKKLKQLDSEVSSKFANSVVRRARRLLSEASVQFIRETAWNSGNMHLIRMLSKEFTYEFNSWPSTPMFWTYKALLKNALDKNIPLIILAKFIEQSDKKYVIRDQQILFFKPHLDSKNELVYQQAIPNKEDLKNPSLVVQGVVDLDQERHFFCKNTWSEQLVKNSVVDIILAAAADHRQYPCSERQVPLHDAEYVEYKEMAQKKGFSLNNPTTFFINHVYSLEVGKLFAASKENSQPKFVDASF